MKEFNFSIDNDYHSQRNNKVIPFSSCNTTSMVMALKQAGLMFHHPASEQPEDYLTSFLLSPRAMEQMEILAPWAIDNEGRAIFPPNQVHVMLEWAVNTLMGKRACRFTTNGTVKDIIGHLMRGGGVVVSGVFLVEDRELGHIVSVAGFMSSQDEIQPGADLSAITHIIIDDPYGDYTTGYRDHRGNNILMTLSEFVNIFHARGSYKKWAHFVGGR